MRRKDSDGDDYCDTLRQSQCNVAWSVGVVFVWISPVYRKPRSKDFGDNEVICRGGNRVYNRGGGEETGQKGKAPLSFVWASCWVGLG